MSVYEMINNALLELFNGCPSYISDYVIPFISFALLVALAFFFLTMCFGVFSFLKISKNKNMDNEENNYNFKRKKRLKK